MASSNVVLAKCYKSQTSGMHAFLNGLDEFLEYTHALGVRAALKQHRKGVTEHQQ